MDIPKKFRTTEPKIPEVKIEGQSEMTKFYDHVFEAFDEFNKTQDFSRLKRFLKSDEYQNYRKTHLKIVREGPLTDRDFEEILEALRNRNWEKFHELIDWSHTEEIMERLMETEEWWEADRERSEKIYEMNWAKIQHCTPAQQAAIKDFILYRNKRAAAIIAQMDFDDFAAFLEKLNLRMHYFP